MGYFSEKEIELYTRTDEDNFIAEAEIYKVNLMRIYNEEMHKEIENTPIIDIEEEQINNAHEHFLILHSKCEDLENIFFPIKTDDNFKVLSYKKKDITKNLLGKMIQYCKNNKYSLYVSFASFKHSVLRREKYCSSFNSISIDLDYYTSQYKNLTSEELQDKIREKIQIPFNFMYSGNGCYITINLDERIYFRSTKEKEIYKNAVSNFITQLEEFGADKKCKDTSRIYRLIGSINQKTEKQSYFLSKTEEVVSYQDFLDMYYISPEEIIKPVKNVEQKVENIIEEVKTTIQASSVASDTLGDIPSLLYSVRPEYRKELFLYIMKQLSEYNKQSIQDLNIILKHREYDIEGCRTYFLLIYALFLFSLSYVENINVLQILNQINNKLINPLTVNEINKIFDTIKRNERCVEVEEYQNIIFPYGKNSIICCLDITAEEQSKTLTLNSEQIFRQSGKLRKEYYLRKANKFTKEGNIIEDIEQGKDIETIKNNNETSRATVYRKIKKTDNLTPKQQEMEMRKERVKELKKQGIKNKDIAKELCISMNTLERLITKINKENC